MIPIFNDVWEHEFNEAEHFSLVHEKYGSHHLEKELTDNSQDNEQEKNSNVLKSEDQVPFHVLADEYKNTSIADIFEKLLVPLPYSKLPSIIVAWDGPPPKFI